ncbi:porin [Xylophilus sp. ASV27]|uniref:porin n=1 Tax=Xylophilus sp. ASV27 TaxID=2795129 RepID=UPI0018ECCCA6|nr:porin [Xylophilus sp. ASV27]
MKIRTTAAAALLLGGGTAFAASEVKLSGFVDLNLEYLKNSGTNGSLKRISSGGLNNSRFNISGQEDLGGANKAYFTIEPMFSADTGTLNSQFRQSFVGMRGDWGDVTLGRQFTPSFWVAGYADPNWASSYSMVNSMEFFYASYRVDNAVQYKTPSFGGVTGRLMYSFGKEDATKDGRFISAAVEYRNGPLFLGFASEKAYTRDVFNKTAIHDSRDNYLSAVYRIGGIEPTFIFHTYDGYYAYPPYVGFTSKGWDAQLGVRWAIDSRNRVHASFVHREDDNNKDIGTANGLTLGYTYGLSKRTDLYLLASHVKNKKDVKLAYPVTWTASPSAGQSPTGIAFGIRHAF